MTDLNIVVRAVSGKLLTRIEVSNACSVKEMLAIINSRLQLKSGTCVRQLISVEGGALDGSQRLEEIEEFCHHSGGEVTAVIGRSDKLDQLARDLKHHKWETREAACLRIGELAKDVEVQVLVPEFQDRLKDGKATVRRAACVALGRIGPSARCFLPNIISLGCDDEDAFVQMAAADAVENINCEIVAYRDEAVASEFETVMEVGAEEPHATDQQEAVANGGEDKAREPKTRRLS